MYLCAQNQQVMRKRIFKRKVYDKMLEWKLERNGSTALLLKGARRVGKSTVAKAFAEKEYKSYILIDFAQASKEVKQLFDNLMDLNYIFLRLQSIYQVILEPRKSAIIFDEVQMCPQARQAIKYLVADGRYDYIETGSLISIKKNVENILIPSEETRLDFIRDCYRKKAPLGQALHRKAMDLFRQYLIVGGMPQAVNAFVKHNDFDEVDRVKRRILNLYRDDIRKHAKGYEMKVEAIYDEIPSQMKNQNQHFKLSSLKQGARFDEYKDAMFWLSDAMIVNHCYNATEPTFGLNLNRDRTLLKCYMGDTGLLISHAFDENGIVTGEVYKKLLLDKLEVNMGMVMENMVAQMLTASGHKLYFYSNSSRSDASSRMEIDFLIAKSQISNRHNISPIEVKSSKNYTLSSLKKFKTKYAEQLHIPYVLHTGDFKEEDSIVFLPLYMTPLL